MLKLLFVPIVIASWMLTGTAHSAPKKEYYGIAPNNLSPKTDSAADDFIIYNNKLMTFSSIFKCFGTGVHLPQGATIKRLHVYLSSDSQEDLVVELLRHDMTNDGVVGLFSNDIIEDGNEYTYSVQQITNYKTVNNARYIYSFNVCVVEGSAFHGAIITYVPKT